jgi:hypothetical protein
LAFKSNIWNCVKKQKSDIQKAEVKVKLVTDTYMLQYHQDKFSYKENAGFPTVAFVSQLLSLAWQFQK